MAHVLARVPIETPWKGGGPEDDKIVNTVGTISIVGVTFLWAS